MIHIERIRMHLPPGFEHRASSIAQLLGKTMATIHPTENRILNNLSIGPIQVSSNASDQEIAGSVAGRIASTLGVGK